MFAKKWMTLIAAATCLSACAGSILTEQPVLPQQGPLFCDVAKPIPNSKRNVSVSRQGIDENNAIGVDNCGW